MAKKFDDMTPKVRREAHKKAWDEVMEQKPAAKIQKESEDFPPLKSQNKNPLHAKRPALEPTKKKSGSSRYRLWAVAAASAVFLFFSLSMIFAGATLEVSPRVEELEVNQNFSAHKNAAAPALSFQLISISGEETVSAEGGDEKDVARKAEGTAVIYNAFGAAPQKLSIDTRLEGSNGKIYKTKREITVPGMKGSVPGSAEVGIYAAEAGDSYNSAPLDFTIVGFKGTSKYAKFYGRAKGDIKGGFIGKEREVPAEEKEKILAELRGKLESGLLERASGQIPEGFILFKDAARVEINSETFVSKPDSVAVEVKVLGTLHGVLFEEKTLTEKIIAKSFPGEGLPAQAEKKDIYLKNIRALAFKPNEGTPKFQDAENINFNLAGAATAIWRADEEKIRSEIAGRKKGDLGQILSAHPDIVSANLSVRPFWKRSVPKDANDIKISVSYPQ